VTVTGKLAYGANAGGQGIGGKTITFDGTGADKLPDVVTNTDGTFIAKGASPNTVATGWTYQAHFAGDSLYVSRDSAIKTYSTTKHATSLTLVNSPSTVATGVTYKVYGYLKDSSTGAVLSSKTITFTAESPITISSKTTDATGKYAADGLKAPTSTGS
jgi:hypothetical protein